LELTKAAWKRLNSIKVDPQYVSGTPEARRALAAAETAATEELTQCIDAVSTLHIKEAVPLLIELLEFRNATPNRLPSLEDYPSALALVEVGAPAIPELHKLFSSPSRMKLAVDITSRILGERLTLLLLSDDQLMADIPEDSRKTIRGYAVSRFGREHPNVSPKDAVARDLPPPERSTKEPAAKNEVVPTPGRILDLAGRLGELEDSIRKLSAPDNSVERLRDAQARTDEGQNKDIKHLANDYTDLDHRLKYLAEQLKTLTDEIRQLKQRMDKAAAPAVPAPRSESGSK
jgi:hypothetical protein